jgi:putative transposase
MARFSGLQLSDEDRRQLSEMQSGGKTMTTRQWRRIRVLELLDGGETVRATAAAVGQYTREVSRVGKRYLTGGLLHALSDDPRPKPERKLDSYQEAAIVALVCGPPPVGRARWTVRLVAEQVRRRGIADEIGRESIRVVLARHELKPWREKNVVRPGD